MSIDKRFNGEPYVSEEDFNSKTQLLSDKTKQEIYSILDNETYDYKKRELIEEALLKDLEKNHVRVEENKEMFGYKGKCVYVNLPAIGNFRGYNFNFFVSDVYIYEDEFDKNPKLTEASFSKTEIPNFLNNFREYMKERGIEMDTGLDFNNLRHRYADFDNYTGCSQAYVTGLNGTYYLNHQNVPSQKGLTRMHNHGFSGSSYMTKAGLLLKI